MTRDDHPQLASEQLQPAGVPGVILVVDDHELLRRSVVQVLQLEFKASRVVEAEDFEAALKVIVDPAVYLAIVDLTMPGMTNPLDLAKMRALRPDLRVVVLSGSDARSDILAALTAGAHGYILKSERTGSVVTRIKHVLAGEIYVPPCIADLPAGNLHNHVHDTSAPDAQSEVVTPRQREVLQLITEGLSNKEIGRRLGVAEGTVKMHVATILKAIGANNRAHAAAIGRKFLIAPM